MKKNFMLFLNQNHDIYPLSLPNKKTETYYQAIADNKPDTHFMFTQNMLAKTTAEMCKSSTSGFVIDSIDKETDSGIQTEKYYTAESRMLIEKQKEHLESWSIWLKESKNVTKTLAELLLIQSDSKNNVRQSFVLDSITVFDTALNMKIEISTSGIITVDTDIADKIFDNYKASVAIKKSVEMLVELINSAWNSEK